jgi:carbon-monoxide dehydrogenase small subunit
MNEQINFILNGKSVSIEIDSSQLLLWVLRTEFGLTGTKYGCGIGFCGSCTVLIDGVAERSCSKTIKDIAHKHITTIEGLATEGELHPVQKSFMKHDAQQCGFCTSGMVMNAVGLLNENPKPIRKEIIAGMNENLCRCGSYNNIIEAIETAAIEMNGKST